MNFLNFDEKKTEVMVFGPNGTCESPLLTGGPMSLYVKPTVMNLGFKMGSDFKFNRQIGAVVKTSFFLI